MKFTDTGISEPDAWDLPSEAMSINGRYIEEEIPQYRTLYVKGRELPSNEFKTQSFDHVDGSKFLNKRLPSRKITIGYQLIAEDQEAFRDCFNRLNALLDFDDALIVFKDEPDKYFEGSYLEASEVPSGRNAITSEFTVYCSDPYKHSMIQKSTDATPDSAGNYSVILQNDGLKTPVDYEFQMQSDNGYIGIVSPAGAMEFGDRDLKPYNTYSFDENLIDWTKFKQGSNTDSGGGKITNTTMTKGSGSVSLSIYAPVVADGRVGLDVSCNVSISGTTVSWSVSASQRTNIQFYGTKRANAGTIKLRINGSDVFSRQASLNYTYGNSGNKFTASGSGSTTASGSVSVELLVTRGPGGETGMNPDTWVYGPASKTGNISGAISATGLGCTTASTLTGSDANGGALKVTVPADKTGAIGAQDFYCSCKPYFRTYKPGQSGALSLYFYDASMTQICGIGLYKHDRSGNYAMMGLEANNMQVKNIGFDSAGTTFAGNVFEISKSGGTVSFKTPVGSYSFYKPAIATSQIRYIVLYAGQWSDRSNTINDTWPVMLLQDFKFQKKNATATSKNADVFSAGDRIRIEGATGKVYKNGLYSPELEVLGTQYFKLPHGQSEIKFLCSSWCTSPPSVKVKFRERWR